MDVRELRELLPTYPDNMEVLNLTLTIKGEQQDLVQTPTHITHMCCTTPDGVRRELTGADAKRALHCYRWYVMTLTNGAWRTPEQLRMLVSLRHIQNRQYLIIKEAINNLDDVVVSYI